MLATKTAFSHEAAHLFEMVSNPFLANRSAGENQSSSPCVFSGGILRRGDRG